MESEIVDASMMDRVFDGLVRLLKKAPLADCVTWTSVGKGVAEALSVTDGPACPEYMTETVPWVDAEALRVGAASERCELDTVTFAKKPLPMGSVPVGVKAELLGLQLHQRCTSI